MFLIFTGHFYASLGGWNDLEGVRETLSEAEEFLESEMARPSMWDGWAHIVDMATRQKVMQFPTYDGAGNIVSRHPQLVLE